MARNKESRFGAADGFDFGNEYEAAPIKEDVKKQASYDYEKRDKAISVVITQSTYDALRELKYKKIIKSTNDLINDLLVNFIEDNKR